MTINRPCPCGAPPRDGSAYCGDDCTPTPRPWDSTGERHDPWADVMPCPCGCETSPDEWRLTADELRFLTDPDACARFEARIARVMNDQRATRLAQGGRTDPNLAGTIFSRQRVIDPTAGPIRINQISVT